MASLIAWPIAGATAGTTLLPSRLMQSTLMGTPRAVRAIAAFPMSSSAGSRKRRLEGHRNSLSPRFVPCGGRSADIPSRPLHGLPPPSRLVGWNLLRFKKQRSLKLAHMGRCRRGDPLFRPPLSVTTLAINCKIILNPIHPTTYQLSPAPKTSVRVLATFRCKLFCG